MAAAAARKAAVPVATAWSIGISHRFEADPDGHCYALFVTDFKSDFLWMFLMRDKSAVSVLEALNGLRAFVR